VYAAHVEVAVVAVVRAAAGEKAVAVAVAVGKEAEAARKPSHRPYPSTVRKEGRESSSCS